MPPIVSTWKGGCNYRAGCLSQVTLSSGSLDTLIFSKGSRGKEGGGGGGGGGGRGVKPKG